MKWLVLARRANRLIMIEKVLRFDPGHRQHSVLET